MNKFTKLSLCAALLAGSLATTAQADTTSTTVQVFAGLAPVMVLTCTDVNFGVWHASLGTRTGGAATITLNNTNQVSLSVGSAAAEVSLSSAFLGPRTGICDVTGSKVTSGTGAASLNAAATGAFVTNGGTGFNSEVLAAPGTAVASFTYALVVSNLTPVITAQGTAQFKVRGTMSIPDGLIPANYGGYKGAAITVTFDDTQAQI